MCDTIQILNKIILNVEDCLLAVGLEIDFSPVVRESKYLQMFRFAWTKVEFNTRIIQENVDYKKTVKK